VLLRFSTPYSVAVGLSPVVLTPVAQSGMSYSGTNPSVTSPSVNSIDAFPNVRSMSQSPQISVPQICNRSMYGGITDYSGNNSRCMLANLFLFNRKGRKILSDICSN